MQLIVATLVLINFLDMIRLSKLFPNSSSKENVFEDTDHIVENSDLFNQSADSLSTREIGGQAYYIPMVYHTGTYPFYHDDGYRIMPPGFINDSYWDNKKKIRHIKRNYENRNNPAKPNVTRKVSTKYLSDGHEIKHKVITSSNKPPFGYIKIKKTESELNSYNPFERSTTKYHLR